MKKTDMTIHFGALTSLTHFAMCKDQISSLTIMEPPHLRE